MCLYACMYVCIGPVGAESWLRKTYCALWWLCAVGFPNSMEPGTLYNSCFLLIWWSVWLAVWHDVRYWWGQLWKRPAHHNRERQFPAHFLACGANHRCSSCICWFCMFLSFLLVLVFWMVLFPCLGLHRLSAQALKALEPRVWVESVVQSVLLSEGNAVKQKGHGVNSTWYCLVQCSASWKVSMQGLTVLLWVESVVLIRLTQLIVLRSTMHTIVFSSPAMLLVCFSAVDP